MSTLFVLYGSATGNAEQIAKDLSSKALPESSPFSKVECQPLENYRKFSNQWLKKPSGDVGLIKHGVIIITSTTGNGEPPENAVKFVRYVKRKPTAKLQPFRNVAYSVLGLGDTNYSLFCETAKVIDSKLIDLGGIRVQPLDCADEGTGLEDVVEPYLEHIHAAMKAICTGGVIGGKSDNGEEKQSEPEDEKNATTIAENNNLQTTVTTPKPIEKSDSPLFVLYGSATGNAEQIAKDLASSYEKSLKENNDNCYFPSVVCCELDDYKKKCLPIWEKPVADGCKHALIMVASTTGNGDPPENGQRFVRYIKRNNTASDKPLQNVAYAVLALGDTNYDQFCETGRTLDRKVGEVGGFRAVPLKCADEATGLEDAVNPWTASIIEKMTIACRGNGLSSTTVSIIVKDKTKEKYERDGEEKKADDDNVATIETDIPTPSILNESKIEVQPSDSSPLSQGSNVVRSLLDLHDYSAPLIEVDNKVLPSIGSSMVKCRLLKGGEEQKLAEELENKDTKGEFDRMTISTSSSNAVHYTFKQPFHSSIVQARYLTVTSTKASEDICNAVNEEKKPEGEISSKTECDKVILDGKQTIDNQFPLIIDNDTKKQSDRNMKRVIEMSLSLPDDLTLEYTPGDSIGLVVENTPENVQFVLNMLQRQHGINPDQKVAIEESNIVAVEDLIRSHIDLCSPIKNKRIIHSLSQVATNEDERRCLRLMASRTPEGDKLFQEYVDKQRISVVDVLREFPSTQVITLGGLLTILPGGIAPRYYSVCSSPLDDSKSLKVAFSVVDYITPQLKVSVGDTQIECGMRRIGGIATRYLEILCSSFMSSSNDREQSSPSFSTPKIKIFPKPSSDFHMPQSVATPLILVGPGTGIAPFVGFLSHRQAQLTSSAEFRKQTASTVVEGTWRGDYDFGVEEQTDIPVSNGDAQGLVLGNDYRDKNAESQDNIGSIDVFFGCRHKDHDYLYHNDMEEFKNQGVLTNLYAAFSRDVVGEQTKYVQDIMRNNADCRARMIDLIVHKKASIYICGDGNAMAKDVQETLITILEGHVETTPKEYVEEMKAGNRLLLDIWTS